jgi:hypothetical protein
LNGALTVRKFIINGNPVFIDPFGNVVEAEEGQAGDDGVLQAQTSSPVYHVSFVNDVCAYYLSGVKDNKISPGNKITTFVAADN